MPVIRGIRRRLSEDRPWFRSELWERVRHIEEQQHFRSLSRTAHQRSLYGLIRPTYYTQAMERCEKVGAYHQLEYSYPFLDRDLASFLMDVPGDVICRNGVPKALLRTAMSGILPASIAERRSKGETSSEFNSAVDRHFPAYNRFLQSDAMAVQLGYLDGNRLADAITKLCSHLHSDDCLSTRMLTDIISLELWLQTFFGTNPDKRDYVEELLEYAVQ